MATALPITAAYGSQTTTQDPQTAGGSAGSGTPVSSVQPGAVNSLDTGTGGVPLTTQNLSTVKLQPTTAVVVKPDAVNQQHSAATTVGAVLLFIVAVVLILAILIPAKNTTE
ncbi:hypothetical protein H7Y63_00825 [Polaromonas sp.]|nr:hypothetical protein [Candidatus Saccharibacteria bacterium]